MANKRQTNTMQSVDTLIERYEKVYTKGKYVELIVSFDLGSKTGICCTLYDSKNRTSYQCSLTYKLQQTDNKFLTKDYTLMVYDLTNLVDKFARSVILFDKVTIVYETVQFRQKSTLASNIYGGLLAVMQIFFTNIKKNVQYLHFCKFTCTAIPVGIIKKKFTGNGKATKQQMLAALCNATNSVISIGADEVDAIAVSRVHQLLAQQPTSFYYL